MQKSLRLIPSVEKYGDQQMEVLEVGTYSGANRVPLRSDAAANDIVETKGLLTSKTKPDKYYIVVRVDPVENEEEMDGSFTYAGNSGKDAQEFNDYRFAIDAVLRDLSRTLATEGGTPILKNGHQVLPDAHPPRKRPTLKPSTCHALDLERVRACRLAEKPEDAL